jgi:hypothetical protein
MTELGSWTIYIFRISRVQSFVATIYIYRISLVQSFVVKELGQVCLYLCLYRKTCNRKLDYEKLRIDLVLMKMYCVKG